ncbi:MAG: patatin-like phospholipase family protein [Pseudomonadales bacterium]|nr:patatin-like phospholipase family protein [Halieaceae bacterium]MCP5164879.1 patatin-like phospholipase family protein [Pseudomonadales bacterium]MCP5189973.1 patatin-like phospholipase family protein [Pseudomonadales bacterium]MCP5205348.1 patatin-like phospholipase family protein [Pseudomonadales bacterium]
MDASTVEKTLSCDEARSGKLGLALSGGGFRAALFHIGVLARLAERDLLRHVAVISTVSGGSIIGAFYYLKVKQLLEGTRADGLQPCAEAYRTLVRELELEFLPAMQRNLRILTFADRFDNARMLASEFSSSERLAKLFDTCFFPAAAGDGRTLLKDLPIQPAAGVQAVAPLLLLNATALNTGHQFQMTGGFVGETEPSSVAGGTAAMPRLPRLEMGDPALSLRQRHRLHQLSLGEAVAASCCVPGLFEPFSLEGLYRDDQGNAVTVRLVDGGIFDNQGLVALFEEHCSHFICSDASESLQWQPQPTELIHQVAMRANDIMMDRIRHETMAELPRERPDRYAVFTLGEDDGSTALGADSSDFLQALRAIRTDLDAFSDLEAWSLMYHGFSLSGMRLGEATADDARSGEGEDWRFRRIEALADDPAQRRRLLRHLEVGSRQFLKVFYLGRPMPWVVIALLSLIPLGLLALFIYLLPPIPRSAWLVLGVIALTAVAFIQNTRIVEWLDQVQWLRPVRRKLANTLRPVGATMLLGALGALSSWINLRIFNRLFLRYGRLRDQSKPRHNMLRSSGNL